MQWFQGGLVFEAHRLCVSLNSKLESNKEETRLKGGSGLCSRRWCRRCARPSPSRTATSRFSSRPCLFARVDGVMALNVNPCTTTPNTGSEEQMHDGARGGLAGVLHPGLLHLRGKIPNSETQNLKFKNPNSKPGSRFRSWEGPSGQTWSTSTSRISRHALPQTHNLVFLLNQPTTLSSY